MKRLRKPQTIFFQVMQRLLLTLSVICFIFFAPGRVSAYDIDTHYVFTYYLARKVGYTPRQARQIASANVGIDLEDNTEPFQLDEILNPLGSAQTVRAKFHAFPESLDALTYALTHGRLLGPDKRQYEKEIRDSLSMWWSQALATGNPGIYLHYYQDTFSHAGYLSFKGHMLPGHIEDFLSRSPEQAEKMMHGTVKELQKFMREYLKREPCEPDLSEIRKVLYQLIEANPAPKVVEINPPNPIPRGVLATYYRAPDWRKAVPIVRKTLGEDENLPEWIEYHFDADGNPKAFANGELTMRVDPNWKLVEATPLEYILGRWRDPTGNLVRINYTPKEGEGNEYHVELSGKHEWKGVYMPSVREWLFTRKPEADEMSEEAPKWARDQVAKLRESAPGLALEWRMYLKADGCKLNGEWHPGTINWTEVKDKRTGKVLLDKSKASALSYQGKGKGRRVEYVRFS